MVKMLEKIQMTVGVLFLSLFFITILIQIVTRYLGISVIWTEEVANYSFIWAIFMGASVMVNRKEHFSFDYFSRKLEGKKRAMLMVFIDAIVLLFALSLAVYGFQAVMTFWDYNWLAFPSFKMGYIWLSIPVMGVTMAIYSISHILKNVGLIREKVTS